jgi:protein-tyrosine phosphatase
VVGNEVPTTGGDFGDRAGALVQAMAEARSKRPNPGDDDVPDPFGRAAAAHEEAGELIVGALLPILARLAALRDDAVDTSERHAP